MNSRFLNAAAVALAVLGLAACGQPDEQTAGQKLDAAVEQARQTGVQAKADAEAAASEVGARLQAGARAGERALSDAAITARINAALAVDDQLKARKIDVDTREGSVVLMGSAPSEQARDRATVLARAVEGVRAVENRLVLQPQG
ncbi:MAG: hypothetical protein DI603_03250 [Roseateles depolymerans]|uniref:BON domain-containing protein n=1 Tax=Roseateles depolymerans TaxID=76731 RepID=A0A2W5DV31_9BURK|nr:MAG: hypothetical protein DI603_03250 [Roseateles depolymerans]